MPLTCGCHAAASPRPPVLPDRRVAPTDRAPTRTPEGICRCTISTVGDPKTVLCSPNSIATRLIGWLGPREARQCRQAGLRPGRNKRATVAHHLVRIGTRRCPFSAIPLEDAVNNTPYTGVGSSDFVSASQSTKVVGFGSLLGSFVKLDARRTAARNRCAGGGRSPAVREPRPMPLDSRRARDPPWLPLLLARGYQLFCELADTSRTLRCRRIQPRLTTMILRCVTRCRAANSGHVFSSENEIGKRIRRDCRRETNGRQSIASARCVQRQ